MARHSGASYQVIQHKPLDLKDFQDILWYVSVPEQYRYIYNIIYILYIIWKWYMIWFVNPMKNQTSTIRLPNFSSQDLEHTVLRQNSWCPPSFWSCFERSLLSTDRILTLFWKNLSPHKNSLVLLKSPAFWENNHVDLAYNFPALGLIRKYPQEFSTHSLLGCP